jgi:uncharacterized protein YjiS (DUF1127 family)
MTTLDFANFADARPGTNSVSGAVLRVVASVNRWYRQRQTLIRLSHLYERLLMDVGLEPSDVYDAPGGKDCRLWAKVYGQPETR